MLKGCLSYIEDVQVAKAIERRELAGIKAQLRDKRRAFPPDQGQLLRGVHPKFHGCVDARFIVNGRLTRYLRVGLFRERGKVFRARICYPNADTLIPLDLIDGKNRTRGVAIGILEGGKRAIVPDRNGSVSQHFLMINTSRSALARLKLAEPGSLYPATAAPTSAGAGETPELTQLRPAFERSGVFDDFAPVSFAHTSNSLQVVGKTQSEIIRYLVEAPYLGTSLSRFGRGKPMRASAWPVSKRSSMKRLGSRRHPGSANLRARKLSTRIAA